MASLIDVHDAIVERLEQAPGLRCHAWPPRGAKPPLAFVTLSAADPISMGRRGQYTYSLDVFVFTSAANRPQDGYRALLEYADPDGAKSVWLAIWDGNTPAAGTFGGLADTNVQVQRFEVLGIEQIDQFDMFGGVFTLEVHTLGSS